MKRLFWTYGLMLWCLSACNLGVAPVTSLQPTPAMQGVRVVQHADTATPPPIAIRATATPLSEATTEATPEQTPEATAESAPDTLAGACVAQEATSKTQYDIDATLYYASKRVDVAQMVTYTNHDTEALNEIVFAIETNNWQGVFELQEVRLHETTPAHELVANRLTVALDAPLAPACSVEVTLVFGLKLPRITSGVTAIKGYFGYSERQVNLSLWLPTVATRQAGEWVVHEFRTIGEQTVLEQADWELTLTVEEASDALTVAVAGTITRPAPQQYNVVFKNARDLSLSLSENYRVSRKTAPSGTVIEVYTFPDAVRPVEGGGFEDAAEHALLVATQATERFEALFGKAPYGRLLVVQGDFPDGMEFSGLVYVSTSWFYQFRGGFENYLTLITVHEVSHQWWYAHVGNDAAFAPWLDEALATYSEYLYIEAFHPTLKNWWWSFRVGYFNPQGAVDSNVYVFANAREYINAVYLRGVQMLHNLRNDIGEAAFFALLKGYAEAGRGRVVDSALFWSLFTPEQLERTQKTREEFLNNPQVP